MGARRRSRRSGSPAPDAFEAGNYVSSGPFQLETWDHQREIVLDAEPELVRRVKPTLTEIHMSMSPEPAQAMAAYEAGENDMLLPVPPEDIERIKADPVLGPEYAEPPALAIVYYNYNNGTDPSGEGTLARCQDPKACPTTNKNFRDRADAGDRQGGVQARDVRQHRASWPARSSCPACPGATPDNGPYPYDPAAHRRAWPPRSRSSASQRRRHPAAPLRLQHRMPATSRACVPAQAWEEAFGLKTDQIGSEFGVFLTQRTAGEYDIARNGWGADYPHPNNQLAGLFTCGGGNNDEQYCNPEFDELIAQAAAEQDPAAQAALYEQANKIIADDAASLCAALSAPTTQLVRPYRR